MSNFAWKVRTLAVRSVFLSTVSMLLARSDLMMLTDTICCLFGDEVNDVVIADNFKRAILAQCHEVPLVKILGLEKMFG